MILYNAIVEGFKQNIPPDRGIEEYLESLQKSVKALRLAYKRSPVFVPYENTEIQAAYLTTYFPHYYQLIYKIFIENVPEIFQCKEDVHLTFIGGGPGSEAYGAIKYIINNCPSVKNIHITILDINAATWEFSHNIVLNNLIESVTKKGVKVIWRALFFDLISLVEINKVKSIIQKSDLLVIQNCLNEIANVNLSALKENVRLLFEYLPDSSYLLMSDLTCGARPIIKMLEKILVEKFAPKFLKTTLSLAGPISLISVHHRPSSIIATHLLNGTDGLMPRKNINYDFSIISKGVIEAFTDNIALGFNSIYRPLDFKKLDANNYINKKIFVGIDFGTSFTVASIAQLVEGKIKITTIPIRQKDHLGGYSSDPLIPTVISLVDYNKLLVGKHAAYYKPYLEYGKNCWHSFKQVLGRIDEVNYPNSILAHNNKVKISNAREGLIFFLKYIKEHIIEYLIEKNLTTDIEYSISVPAAFSFKEKKALKSCFLKAGIECEDAPFIEEPNAALINYLFEENINTSEEAEKNILVLDLGAGTVDVSVLFINVDIDGLSSKLLSVVRLGNIGGNLIDELIAQSIMKKSTITCELNEATNIELISLCEQLKIKVCKNIVTDKNVGFSLPNASKSTNLERIASPDHLKSLGIEAIQITYADFYSLMIEYWDGTIARPGIKKTIERSLCDAKVTIDAIDKVIVTGGGGRNPYLKNMVANLFAKSNIIIPDNIQEQVARGVALQSFVLHSFGKNIITPILSDNIYVEGSNKIIKLFENGESIPTVDFEVYLSEAKSCESRYIESYAGLDKMNIRYFVIPKDEKIEKLVFYITPDQDLKCDIIGATFQKEAIEIFEKPNNKLIALK